MRMFFLILFFFLCLLLRSKSQKEEEKQWLFLPESKWDQEWKSGDWKYLETVAIERSKISVIGVLVQLYAPPNASVLDIGCGEGAISDFLIPSQRERYVGVDISSEAIKQAKRIRGPPLKFVHSVAHQFHPKHHFDVILFSDMLYYVEYQKVLKQFHEVLNPNGIMIISIFSQREKLMYEDIWNFAQGLMEKIDEMDMSGFTKKGKNKTPEKTSFHIEVYRKKKS